MSDRTMVRPETDEHPHYFERYINLVDEGNIVEILAEQQRAFADFILQIPADKEDHAYAQGKWTIKQVVNHIIDVERVFTYRAMALSRNEANPIAGFDHNAYVDAVDVSNRALSDLIVEFEAVRSATVQLYRFMPDAYATRSGIISSFHTTVRAMAYMTVGHVLHHEQILTERYL